MSTQEQNTPTLKLRLENGIMYGNSDGLDMPIRVDNIQLYKGEFTWAFDIVLDKQSVWYSGGIPNEATFTWSGHFEKGFEISHGKLGPLLTNNAVWTLAKDITSKWANSENPFKYIDTVRFYDKQGALIDNLTNREFKLLFKRK